MYKLCPKCGTQPISEIRTVCWWCEEPPKKKWRDYIEFQWIGRFFKWRILFAIERYHE